MPSNENPETSATSESLDNLSPDSGVGSDAPEPPADPLAGVREALSDLFKKSQVQQVVCIDDDFAIDHELNPPSDLLGEIDAANFHQLGTIGPELLKVQEEQRPNKFADLWKAAKREERKTVYEQLMQLAGPEGKKYVGIQKIADLLESTNACVVQRLTLEEWRLKQADMFKTKFDGKFTLLLIDQDFKKEGGDLRAGISILQSIQAAINDSDAVRLRCALLTNTKKPGEEHGSCKDFAKNESLTRSRFMLISKQRLTDDHLEGFVVMVRLAILNPQCEELRTEAAKVYDQALKEATTQLEGVTVYDFERIVLASSREEGVWEPDTLFRILGLYLRREARRLASLPGNRLRGLANSLRLVAGSTNLDPLQEQSKTTEIRRLELYEDADYLNGHYTPIDLGDVFEAIRSDGSAGKRYMLIAQPCEIMVRLEPPLDGKRRHTAIEAVLVEVVAKKPDDGYFTLDYFETSGENAYVAFRRARTISLNILDLCALRSDGRAELAETDQLPLGLVPTWALRHPILIKLIKQSCKKFSNYSKGLAVPEQNDKAKRKEVEITHGALASYATCDEFGPNPLFSVKLEAGDGKNRIQFGCRRIRRLNQPLANALLTTFTQHMSRAAFDHDFGDSVPLAVK